MIWTKEYLDRVQREGEEEIARETKCLIDRISLTTSIDQFEFTLPDYVIDVRKVYWKGIRLNPVSGMEFQIAGYDIRTWQEGSFNGEAFTDAFNLGIFKVDHISGYSGSGGRPYDYFYYGFGENIIRLYPGSNENLIAYPDGLWSNNLGQALIVEFYRTADGEVWKIPDYFRRRTIKSYVLWKAFSQEGAGQNLKAAQYYKARYLLLLARAKTLVNNVHRSYKRVAPSEEYNAEENRTGRYYNFEGDYGYQGKGNVARPVLPSNFGIVVED
jgi:hypothetical protein